MLEQTLHQLLYVGMLVQVEAITDLALLNDEVFRLCSSRRCRPGMISDELMHLSVRESF